MKRALVVDYQSDSDDDVAAPAPIAPAKKRKLPALSETFIPKVPIDNPALHQGRVRTVPFVQGQWCAHVYVPVDLSPSLHTTLLNLLARAQALCPTLHSLLDPPAPASLAAPATPTPTSTPTARTEDRDSPPSEAHISLTRPLFLHTSQRPSFLTSIRAALKQHSAFDISFAQLSTLENDEHTRIFLVCEVGAGFNEVRPLPSLPFPLLPRVPSQSADALIAIVQLHTLTKSLQPSIQEIRQEAYYAEPRYHASIGWALLAPRASSSPAPPARDTSSSGSASPAPPTASAQESAERLAQEPEDKLGEQFPTIPHFPTGFIQSLQREFGAQIRESVRAGEVRVRIGRDETSVRLA
ncbi:hypothetical protein CALVIDRAFT_563601 [Calocera viscosa TUFC12733]|uniref:U6 snRNA phosphodiesterase 1 n=1 Tax=Calocera viscosa (strain TUFC12733) TaxID=1330018 RepID=A0A167MQS7_CALVF|nr:hypothetical protein CALVIDRAFT_563601 [Calocera viscosa TUFC12733]